MVLLVISFSPMFYEWQMVNGNRVELIDQQKPFAQT